jgi:hypothetical protein
MGSVSVGVAGASKAATNADDVLQSGRKGELTHLAAEGLLMTVPFRSTTIRLR